MAKELDQSSGKPRSNIYTLLIAVAAVALATAVVVAFLDLKDVYGLKPGAMLKPLAEAVKTAAEK